MWLSIKFVIALVLFVVSAHADDASTNDVVNLSSDQIARLRQFKAENLYFTSEDGYIINVVYIEPVRKTNKRPVVFNHGSTQSSTYFMVNSAGARPKDYSNLDLSSMSQAEFEKLARDPVSNCLPLLLSCCGYPVFLINRRGTEYSLGKTSRSRDEVTNTTSDNSKGGGLISELANRMAEFRDHLRTSWLRRKSSRQSEDELSRQQQENQSGGLLGFLKLFLRPQLNIGSILNTLDSEYWNFSLDEQALMDLPPILRGISKKTGSEKLAYVGHSLGNVLMFMLQSEQPEWAEKIEPFLAWSPDIYLGSSTSAVIPLALALQPILENTQMPFPPTPITPLTRTLLASLCQTELAQNTVCSILQDALWGPSDRHQLALPAFVATQFYAISTHEAAQLAQTHKKTRIHKYDMGKIRNLKYYGQEEPPIYNVSRIISKSISLWRGIRDALADPTDVELFKKDLTVSVDDRFITETPFNHYCLMFDRNVSILVNIPSVKLIASYN